MNSLILFLSLQLLVTNIPSIIALNLPVTPEKNLLVTKLRNTITQNYSKYLPHELVCVEKFVTTYLDELPSRITVILSDDNISDAYNTYLTQFQQIRSLYILTKNSIIKPNQNASLNVMLIMKNYIDFENATLKLNELCGRNCRYAVLLINNFTDKQVFIEAAKNLVQSLWLKKVSNVIIIGSVKKSLIAAKSQAFKPNIQRKPMDPIIVGTCQNGTWKSKKNLFSPMKMNNCTVNMGYFDREPYSHRQNNTAVGFEVSIIKIIANAINITVNLLEIIVYDNSTRTDEISIIFNKNKNPKSIDFIIGGVLWRPSESIDFVIPYEVAKYIFLLPTEVKFSVGGLISPFESEVWVVIGCVSLLAMLLRFLVFSKISLLEILSIVIGVAWYKQPKRLSYRIKFMSWIIFGYILTQYYLASMAGELMSRSVVKFETYKDLVMSKKAVAGTAVAASYFKRVKGNSKEFDDLSRIFLERYIIINRIDVNHKIDNLVNGKNKKLGLLIITNCTSSVQKYDPNILYILPEVLITQPLGFATWRGLPYLSVFEEKLMWIQQAGIVKYLGEKAAPRNQFKQKVNDEEKEFIQKNFITFEDLLPAFLCLIFAHIGSLLCFFGELIISRFLKTKKFPQL